jgi:hypothetical protein
MQLNNFGVHIALQFDVPPNHVAENHSVKIDQSQMVEPFSSYKEHAT